MNLPQTIEITLYSVALLAILIYALWQLWKDTKELFLQLINEIKK